MKNTAIGITVIADSEYSTIKVTRVAGEVSYGYRVELLPNPRKGFAPAKFFITDQGWQDLMMCVMEAAQRSPATGSYPEKLGEQV